MSGVWGPSSSFLPPPTGVHCDVALSAIWPQPAHSRLQPVDCSTRLLWQFFRDHSNPATAGIIEPLGHGHILPEAPEPESHPLPPGADARELVEAIHHRREKSELCQPAEVRKWMEETYPLIAKRTKAEKADILWGDETEVSNQDHSGRGYSPVGVTPVVRGMARRVTTSMISAIGNRGDMRFMIFKGGLKVDTFIRFLGRLIKSSRRKVFLIVDNLRVHKAVKVREWVEARAEQIELFFIPPYSPDLNPDEYLNNTVKAQMRNQPAAATHPELKARLSAKMKSNQRRPELIRSLFRHPSVAYAA